MSNPKHLYRYNAEVTGYLDVRVQAEKYSVIKVTEKGYWISVFSNKRWVAKEGKKKFAHVTKEEALESFIYRRQYHNKIMKVLTARNERILGYIGSNKEKILKLPSLDFMLKSNIDAAQAI